MVCTEEEVSRDDGLTPGLKLKSCYSAEVRQRASHLAGRSVFLPTKGSFSRSPPPGWTQRFSAMSLTRCLVRGLARRQPPANGRGCQDEDKRPVFEQSSKGPQDGDLDSGFCSSLPHSMGPSWSSQHRDELPIGLFHISVCLGTCWSWCLHCAFSTWKTPIHPPEPRWKVLFVR